MRHLLHCRERGFRRTLIAMALISCPDCGKQVSTKAVACPNCGHPIATAQTSSSTTDVAPRKPVSSASEDKIIFQDQNVKITTNLVIVGGTRYALRNINSVRIVRHGIGGGAAFVVIVLFVIGLLLMGNHSPGPGLLLVLIGIGAIVMNSIGRALVFDTSSGAVHGMRSFNAAYLQGVAAKIAEAMSLPRD